MKKMEENIRNAKEGNNLGLISVYCMCNISYVRVLCMCNMCVYEYT